MDKNYIKVKGATMQWRKINLTHIKTLKYKHEKNKEQNKTPTQGSWQSHKNYYTYLQYKKI